ncbi:MAG: sigma-70 family RNA polymerase sigma factor [Planctomycetes bacterium]|nr:sigma-70 family RNA polymerase sigma factor [Planctomycetota bacterium]
MNPLIATNQSADWATLVEAARRGDDDAFGQICDRMTGYLLLTANDLGTGLTAKFGVSDIVQQTLFEARRDIESFDGTSENELRSWLVRLVRHNLIDSARHYRQTKMRNTSREQPMRMHELADEYAGSQKTASSIMRRRETDGELLHAVAKLPTRRRRVIELRHWQEMSFAEIGRELEISEAAARKLLARALEELRKNLAASHANQPTQPR